MVCMAWPVFRYKNRCMEYGTVQYGMLRLPSSVVSLPHYNTFLYTFRFILFYLYWCWSCVKSPHEIKADNSEYTHLISKSRTNNGAWILEVRPRNEVSVGGATDFFFFFFKNCEWIHNPSEKHGFGKGEGSGAILPTGIFIPNACNIITWLL